VTSPEPPPARYEMSAQQAQNEADFRDPRTSVMVPP
jgi:hypothetical protein